MKNLLGLAGLLLVSAFFVGCGDKGNDNNNNNNNNNVAGPCPAGSFYSSSGCIGVNGGPPTQPTFQLNNGFYADNWTNTTGITIVNSQKMKDFFKFGMGVCDRAAYNGGTSACDSYTGGRLDMIIQFPSNGINMAIATIIAQPRQQSWGSYQYQLPSGWGFLGAALGYATGIWLPDPKYYQGVERNPLRIENMAVSIINNSAGFEARGYGPGGSAMAGTLLSIQVPQGKMEDASFKFNFLVGDTAAARGTMRRCQYPNCGL
ncbi:MAG: hypothetical protein H7061_05610 [Bdellovibrionaceae bacterium]|nr:hypothetical protein [Bdellovibrio sp.]